MAKSEVANVEPNVLDLFESLPGETEVLEEDMGEEVSWEDTPMFMGIYTGVHKRITLADADGVEHDSNLWGFSIPGTGVKRAIWGNYQIDAVMEGESGHAPIAAGDLVLFSWTGKRDTGKGGRTVNVYEIRVKRQVA